MTTAVRSMHLQDLTAAAEVHRLAFVRQKHSVEWLSATLNAYPRFFCFVAESQGAVVGYILWAQKSGFRDQAVLELDQIAVLPERHGQGIGRALIDQSLPLVKDELARQGAALKHIIVNTRADNHAQQLQRSALGAEVVATIADLYSADEVFMVARNTPLQPLVCLRLRVTTRYQRRGWRMYRFNVGLMCCVAIASGIAALWGLANNDWSYQANSLVAGLFGGASVISVVYCVMLSRPGGVVVAQLGVLLAYLVSLVLAVGLGGLLGGTAWVMATDEVSFLGALVELWTLIAATGLPLLGITAGMFFYVGRKQVAGSPQYRNAVK